VNKGVFSARIHPVLLCIPFLLAATRLPAQSDTYSAQDKNWFTLETKHFLVHYHEGAERTAQVAAKVAEDIYGPVTFLYQHEPDSKVSLVIKDLSDYSNGAAYFFNNKIELWASPLDFDLRGTHNWMRNVLSHEFTHIIQIQAAMKFGRGMPALTFQWFGYEKERRTDVLSGYPNTLVSYPLPGVIVPPWLAEGTAQYMRPQFGYENWDSHRDMILRSYVLSDSMLTWSEMGAFGKTSLGNESVYNSGYNFTRYLSKTYGEESIVRLTHALSKPFVLTVEAAFRDTYGKPGTEIYKEWQRSLQEEYRRRIAPVLGREVRGNRIADVGFGNFYPVYSPGDDKIAYISNKTGDYFSQSSLFIYDPATGKEEAVESGVRSSLSWSADATRIVYSKYNPPTVYGQLFYDLFAYDFEKEESVQLTHGLRAFNPAYSPDGKTIAFVFERDGSINIGLVDASGDGFRQLTSFTHGEQAFAPQWSPDGKTLVFAYAPRTHRQIASIGADGNGFAVRIANQEYDCRDPRYSSDGASIYYAADRTGIFNIYRYDIASGASEQLTNVTGGAFMPDMDGKNNLVYAEYTASGYKIALLPDAQALDASGHEYLPAEAFVPRIVSTDAEKWNWEKLASYDDTTIEPLPAKPYSNVFQSMMFFPTLRIDEYNPDNKGIALLKPGIMMFSSDMLNRVELTAAASINTKLERDLFMNMTYRGPLPLFSSLGLFPDFTFEVYNVTRSTSSKIGLTLDTVDVGVDFNLLEFAVSLKHAIVNEHTLLDIGYSHGRYTSTIDGFEEPSSGTLYAASDNLYYIGNSIHANIKHSQMLPSRESEINPAGFRASLYYNFEFNRYNPDGDFEVDLSSGILKPKYKDFNFHRLEGNVFLGLPLPGWDHTLSVKLRAGTIAGPPVNDFFNFYAGGISGMQGYTFYSIGGNEIATANVTYRFPIVKSLDIHIGHILFDKLYGGLFFDAGDAVSTPDEFRLGALKRDAGFELRLESYSFAMYPTRIFFSGAYGLDEFQTRVNMRRLEEKITYGKEWRWYFGVLFSFNLSDKELK